jgi:methylaspartate ammonia-lyase
VTFVTPSVTVIRDEAKIVEQIEKTRRLKIYLPYGVAMALICAAVKIAEHF